MYDLNLLGWHSFQKLCLTICREVLGQTVQSFRDTADGGRDAAFCGTWRTKGHEEFRGRFVIQAKFTSKRGSNLKPSELSKEFEKARALVSSGECNAYILMTNALLTGASELKLKSAFYDVGVEQVGIFGYDWICDTIRENKRLRMHVPCLYGLGDLSTILDERAYSQSKALLDSLKDDLSKVVITGAYSRASDALDRHRFVLLVGEPAAGKTTIASMLSLAASDLWGAETLKLDKPAQVVHQHWNPDGPPQLFWIDDAFGMTQFEIGRVAEWNHSFSRVEAMLRRGSRVVLTSRDYIYAQARTFLKKGAFPLLDESQVAIDVRDLTGDERDQILYNHIKLGNQNKKFKSTIKPWLAGIAGHPRFIPETARRLGNSFFTKSLQLSARSLADFVERQRELLVETITGLDAHSRAALALVYMRNSSLESPVVLSEPERGVIERFGSSPGPAVNALHYLNNSLVHFASTGDKSLWVFKHPTIRDAFASFLLVNPELLGVYVQGVSLRDLMAEVTCGNVGIEGAVVLPMTLFPLVNQRLNEEIPKVEKFQRGTTRIYDQIIRFLIHRCSDAFLSQYPLHERILKDMASPGLYLHAVSEVGLAVRLHRLGALPEDCRVSFVAVVIEHAIEGTDLEVFKSPSLLSVLSEDDRQRLMELTINDMIPSLPDIEESWQENFDGKEDPGDYLRPLIAGLEGLAKNFVLGVEQSASVKASIDRLNLWISNEVSEYEGDVEDVEEFQFDRNVSSLSMHVTGIFDDVDE